MRFHQISLWALFVGLTLSYSNCSNSGFQTQNFDLESVQVRAGLAAGHLNSDGSIVAYQDRAFNFKPPESPANGIFAISTSVEGLSFNATTGTLSGWPRKSGDSASFTVSVTGSANKTYGPYFLRTTGNPLKEHQWHLNNYGQKNFSSQAGVVNEDLRLGATIAGDVTGRQVRIVVSDTGIYQAHPGLSPNIWAAGSRNYLLPYSAGWSGDSTPNINQSELAHGTQVAGLMAEKGWTNFGGRGVAPDASLSGFLYIQAQNSLNTSGYKTAAYLDQFQGDFDIFNYSWGEEQCGLSESSQGFFDKLLYGVTYLRQGKGAIYVKAAGNDYIGNLSSCYGDSVGDDYYLGNSNFVEEDSTPYMIMVGATNAKGKSSSYSSPGSNIWISAPGGEFGGDANTVSTDNEPALLTTDFPGCGLGKKSLRGNSFDSGTNAASDCMHTSTMNGTSGAAPILAGAVALILEANPQLTWRDVKYILAKTADKVDPTSGVGLHPAAAYRLSGHNYQEGWVTNAAGNSFHNWFGFGRVNVDKAVALARSYGVNLGIFKQTNSGGTWKYQSGAVNLAVPDASAAGVSHSLSVSDGMSIEAVQVSVSISNCIGEIGLELRSPSGTKSILMNINSFILEDSMSDHIFLSNAFFEESSLGSWTLKVIDGAAGCNASLVSWRLNVLGH